MKHKTLLILTLLLPLTFCGCRQTFRRTDTDTSSVNSSVIMDDMYTDYVNDKEFIVFKTHDKLYETDGDFNSIDFSKGVEPLALNNGEFARFNADVRIDNGGIAGYCNKPTVQKIHSQKKITLDDAIKECSIPEITEIEFSLATVISRYSADKDTTYLIFRNNAPIATTFDIYRNGEFVTSYERLDKVEDIQKFLNNL